MEDAVGVEVRDRRAELAHQALDLRRRKGRRHRVEQPAQLVLAVLEDEEDRVELRAHRHLVQPDDVRVAQAAEQRDLAQRGERHPLAVKTGAAELHPLQPRAARLAVARLGHRAVRALADLLELLEVETSGRRPWARRTCNRTLAAGAAAAQNGVPSGARVQRRASSPPPGAHPARTAAAMMTSRLPSSTPTSSS